MNHIMYVDPEKAHDLGSTYNFIDPSLYNFIALNSYQVLLTALIRLVLRTSTALPRLFQISWRSRLGVLPVLPARAGSPILCLPSV